jgi:SAM-dependent methyltransferase
MNLLETSELAKILVCPLCRGGALVPSEAAGVTCLRCSRAYGAAQGVLSFLVEDELSETNHNEIRAHAADPADEAYAEKMIHKEDWFPLYTHQMKWVIEVVDGMLPRSSGGDLFALGAGTGFDLRLLLRRREFERVFASDISPSATALIPRALADFPGTLGVFASEFGHSPVPKRPGSVGLVFQALHHAVDAHATLETLLDHNFDHLVIVEPLTNPIFRVLAHFDLVQRVEYSGTRPDWLSLRRIRALAAARGYRLEARTWWEVPPYFSPQWLGPRPWLWRPMYRVVDGISRATNTIRFGSMGAIQLSRSAN